MCVLPALLLGPASLSGQGGAPQLTLDPVNVRQDVMVSFSTLPVGLENRSDFSDQRFILGQTDENAWRLWVDTESIQQIRFNAFTFTAYLAEAKDATQEAFKFQITGNPTGLFRDVPAMVSFHVKAPSGNCEGRIRIPVYNAAKTDMLLTEKQAEPAYVSVSSGAQLQIPVRNAQAALPIHVTDVAVNKGCPQCWLRISSSISEKNPLVLNPGSTGQLALDLAPNSFAALLRGALLIKTDVPHDTLAISFTYHTIPGGPEKRQTIPAMVRFGPGLFSLVFALCCGIALGLGARYLLTGKLGKENERAVHAICTALVLGAIAEFVGIMLTAYGSSKFVILGLDIDPRQLFPAFILAMLVSGGPALAAWMKEMLPKPQ